MKVVFDSSVVISALLSPTGPCAELLSIARANRFSIALSTPILAEYHRALSYPRVAERLGEGFDASQAAIDSLARVAEMHESAFVEPVVAADPRDDIFIACAVAARARYIVTGDRHLLDLVGYRGIEIVRPHHLVAILQMPDFSEN